MCRVQSQCVPHSGTGDGLFICNYKWPRSINPNYEEMESSRCNYDMKTAEEEEAGNLCVGLIFLWVAVAYLGLFAFSVVISYTHVFACATRNALSAYRHRFHLWASAGRLAPLLPKKQACHRQSH